MTPVHDRSATGGAGAIGGIALATRFLLELAMLAALFAWGIRVVEPLWLSVIIGVGGATAGIVVWGAFIAPRAPRRLADPARLALEIAVFGLAALGLVSVGLSGWGMVLAVVAALNIAILQLLGLR